MGDTERQAALMRGEWYGRGHADQPEVLTAAEAWHRRADGFFFYLVTWWGDLPAGFQAFRFLAMDGNASYAPQFRIGVASEPQEQEAALEAHELVLAFALLPDAAAGDE